MRRLLWALILIPILIGSVLGLTISLMMTGTIHVVTPGLTASVANPVWASVLAGPTNSTLSRSFTIQNSGQLTLRVTYSFTTTNATWATGNLTLAGNVDLNLSPGGLILAPGSPPTSVTAGFMIKNAPPGTFDVKYSIILSGIVQ